MNYYESEMVLDEGPLVLDFANTLEWHASAAPIESLLNYSTLVQWALDKKIFSLMRQIDYCPCPLLTLNKPPPSWKRPSSCVNQSTGS